MGRLPVIEYGAERIPMYPRSHGSFGIERRFVVSVEYRMVVTFVVRT